MTKKEDLKAPEEQGWFTVPEAAAYLRVSVPTIFRWMKEGELTFFKIGGATRFTQESLDTVVRKSTGRTEAEASRARCASCGHGELVEGRLQGTGRLYFRPEGVSFWTLAEPMVETAARVCPACGHVQIHADVEKLKKLRPPGGQGKGRRGA